MIYQLTTAEFHKAATVLAPLAEWNVYLTAVLNQDSPGRVYVDELDHPQAAFAVSLDCAYLAGDPYNEAFNSGIATMLEGTLFAGDRVNPDDPELAICLETPSWEESLADILSHWRWPPIWGQNYHYVMGSPKLDWRKILPSGYKIAQLDADILGAQGKRLPKNIADSIRIGWHNRQNFLGNGFGFVALQADEIVCWCLADVTTGHACELGIETAAAHRRRGLATAVTAATVAYCRQAGFHHIGWHCGADNPASIATAENVGFVRERPYSFYAFKYDEAAHFAELGRIYFFEAQLYAEAAEMLEISLELNDASANYVYFLAARAWGHLAEGQKAVRCLNRAVDQKFNDRALLERLPEFSFLHGQPEWQALLQRLEIGQ